MGPVHPALPQHYASTRHAFQRPRETRAGAYDDQYDLVAEPMRALDGQPPIRCRTGPPVGRLVACISPANQRTPPIRGLDCRPLAMNAVHVPNGRAATTPARRGPAVIAKVQPGPTAIAQAKPNARAHDQPQGNQWGARLAPRDMRRPSPPPCKQDLPVGGITEPRARNHRSIEETPLDGTRGTAQS